MAWPPPVLPINFTNATPQQDTHPAAHVATNQAVNDTVAKLAAVSADVDIAKTRLYTLGLAGIAPPVVGGPVDYSFGVLNIPNRLGASRFLFSVRVLTTTNATIATYVEYWIKAGGGNIAAIRVPMVAGHASVVMTALWTPPGPAAQDVEVQCKVPGNGSLATAGGPPYSVLDVLVVGA